MIIMNIRGGFGNQLFEYAMGYARAKENKTILLQDLSQYAKGYFRGYDLDKLKLDFRNTFAVESKNRIISIVRRSLAIGGGYRFYKEKKGYTVFDQDAIIKSRISTYYFGLWQSYRYFDQYRDDIIRQFQPSFDFSPEASELRNDIRNDEKSVAIHIRRGDYIQVNGCISAEYYKQAISKMLQRVPGARFYFFSDDIPWVKENFANIENAVFVNNDKTISDLEEFFIMSSANHQIIANSTYSWWAAYLNQNMSKIVYAPEVANWKGDFYPPEWNLIHTEIVKG